MKVCFFFFYATATTEIYTLSLHDALPICLEFTAFENSSSVHWANRWPATRRGRRCYNVTLPSRFASSANHLGFLKHCTLAFIVKAGDLARLASSDETNCSDHEQACGPTF